jgi:hypothetical protein
MTKKSKKLNSNKEKQQHNNKISQIHKKNKNKSHLKPKLSRSKRGRGRGRGLGSQKKKTLLKSVGGAGEPMIYKSSRGTQMSVIYMDKMTRFRDFSAPGKFIDSAKYFNANYPNEWQQIQSFGTFINPQRRQWQGYVLVLEKAIYYLNYVYFQQQKARSILFEIEDTIIRRLELIFNSTILKEDLLQESQKKNPTPPPSTTTSKPVSSPPVIDPFEALASNKTQYKQLFKYLITAESAGPNFEIDKTKNETFFLSLKEKFSDVKSFFFGMGGIKADKATSGVYVRKELDKLFFRIEELKKALKEIIIALAFSQNKLYLFYLFAKTINNVILRKLYVLDEDEKRVMSLNKSQIQQFQQKKALRPLLKAYNDCWTKLDKDYQELIYMYETELNGFWIQDEYGRVLTNLYKPRSTDNTEESFAKIMKNIDISNFNEQIFQNMMNQLYIKIANKNITFTKPNQPKQTYAEVKTIASERFCFSRIMVQYFVWDMLMQIQGMNIDIDKMIANPKQQTISFETKTHQINKSGLLQKMISADSNMEYKSQDNYVGWKNDENGAKGYMAFSSIFGYYDQKLINMGIPIHAFIESINKLKDTIEKSLIKGQIKETVPKHLTALQKGGFPQQYSSNPYGPLQIESTPTTGLGASSTIKLVLKRQLERKTETRTSAGWFDIWKQHFLSNFMVFSILINSYMSYILKQTGTQPDVYYNYYKSEIHKQFVKAHSSCGLLDMLYRTFYSHMSDKIKLTDNAQIQAFSFEQKLNNICILAQNNYLFIMSTNRVHTFNIEDQYFQVRLQIASQYIDNIFKKYNDSKLSDGTDVLGQNFQLLLKYISENQNMFINFDECRELINLSINSIANTNMITPIDISGFKQLTIVIPTVITPSIASPASAPGSPAPIDSDELKKQITDAFELYNKETDGVKVLAEAKIKSLGDALYNINIFSYTFFNSRHNTPTNHNFNTNNKLKTEKQTLIDSIGKIQNEFMNKIHFIDYAQKAMKTFILPLTGTQKQSIPSEVQKLKELCEDEEKNKQITKLITDTQQIIVILLKKLKKKLPKFQEEIKNLKAEFDAINTIISTIKSPEIQKDRQTQFNNIMSVIVQLSTELTTPDLNLSNSLNISNNDIQKIQKLQAIKKEVNKKENKFNDKLKEKLKKINDYYQQIKLGIIDFSRKIEDDKILADIEITYTKYPDEVGLIEYEITELEAIKTQLENLRKAERISTTKRILNNKNSNITKYNGLRDNIDSILGPLQRSYNELDTLISASTHNKESIAKKIKEIKSTASKREKIKDEVNNNIDKIEKNLD